MPRHSLSPAAARKRPRSPETVEDAWHRHCKASAAGSRRATHRYLGWPGTMPEKLVDFAPGGRYHTVDPPLKPMPEKFRRDWEAERAKKAEWVRRLAGEGSSSGAAAPVTGDEEEEEEEEEGPLFLEAVAASKKEAEEKEERERQENIAAVEEMEAREVARKAVVVILDD